MSKKEKDKPEIFPAVCVDHDREKYHIEVELPGVNKADISLEMGEQSFCIRAPKEEIVYSACYTLAHSVNTSKVDAKFDNGMLLITAPLMRPLGGTKVTVK